MKTRDLNTLKKRIGDFEPFIRQRLKTQTRVNVLEVGCGLGVALSELADKYPQVTFYGMNKKHYHGQIERSNITYLYGDAGQSIALEDGTVDIAFSIQAIQFIPNKVGCFMEVFRTLKAKGQFWFDFPARMYGGYGTPVCTVADGERIMNLEDYLGTINNPNIINREFSYYWEGIALTKKMILVEKNTDELELNLDDHFCTDDLTLIDCEKKGYLATHYYTKK